MNDILSTSFGFLRYSFRSSYVTLMKEVIPGVGVRDRQSGREGGREM